MVTKIFRTNGYWNVSMKCWWIFQFTSVHFIVFVSVLIQPREGVRLHNEWVVNFSQKPQHHMILFNMEPHNCTGFTLN